MWCFALACALANTSFNFAEAWAFCLSIVSRMLIVARSSLHYLQRADIHNLTLIQDFVPGLKTLSPSTIEGKLNSETGWLSLKGDLPKILYNDKLLLETKLDIEPQGSNQLGYQVKIKSLESPGLQVYMIDFSGNAADNTLHLLAKLRDKKIRDKYAFEASLKKEGDSFVISLSPDKLVLNREKWDVDKNNKIEYGPAGIHVQSFSIKNSGQFLGVQSENKHADSPLGIVFKNFNLATVTKFTEADESLVGGLVNGNVRLLNPTGNLAFTSDLKIDSLRFMQDHLGKLNLEASSEKEGVYSVSARLDGIHEAELKGNYTVQPREAMNFDVDIRKFDLQYISGLSGGQLQHNRGLMSGKINITGNTESPLLDGSLHFKEVSITPTLLNAPFSMKNEAILLKGNYIEFKNFTLRDTLNSPTRINGRVSFADLYKPSFNLKMKTDNFMVMNSAVKDNELFYGKMWVDIDMDVKGNTDQPVIDARVGIKKGTNFTFVMPDQDPQIQNQEGIVEYIDMDAPPYNGRIPLKVDSLSKSSFRGMDIITEIILDKNAEFHMVIDPQNGDGLMVKGEANLSAQINPGGTTTVTGRYQLSDGNYSMNLGGFVSKLFKIVPGSSIQFNGEPTDATVDITARYEVITSPIDLVADQLQGFSQSEMNMYRQKYPFIVNLKMKGELMKPVISFDLDMQEKDKNAFNGLVYTRIQQINANENDLNKQVVALLTLSRFIADNPFESLAGGTTVEEYARQSASKLLTSQLNNLAASLIQGVDINFDVKSGADYSTGAAENRTDLDIALSKKLLSDRLIITVGNNFALEGSQKNNTNANNFASNLNVEYLLSKNGQFRLRAYRRNQTEGIIEGQIIETGIGFTMLVDFDKVKDILDKIKSNARKN